MILESLLADSNSITRGRYPLGGPNIPDSVFFNLKFTPLLHTPRSAHNHSFAILQIERLILNHQQTSKILLHILQIILLTRPTSFIVLDQMGNWFNDFFQNLLEYILNTNCVNYHLLVALLQQYFHILLIQIRDYPFSFQNFFGLLPYMSSIHLQLFNYSLVPKVLGCLRSLIVLGSL